MHVAVHTVGLIILDNVTKKIFSDFPKKKSILLLTAVRSSGDHSRSSKSAPDAKPSPPQMCIRARKSTKFGPKMVRIYNFYFLGKDFVAINALSRKNLTGNCES